MKKFTTFLLLILSFSLMGIADAPSKDEITKKIKKLSGVNNAGRDFWFSVPPPYLINGNGNATQLYIFAEEDASVLLETDNKTEQFQVKANNLFLYELSVADAQPYDYQIGRDPNPAQVYDNRGIHVTSNKPLVMYVVARYSATSDGFLVLPTAALGSEYVATCYDSRAYNPNALPNMLTIVSPYDDNDVEITINGNNTLEVDVLGQGSVGPGDLIDFKMDKGDVIVVSTKGPQANNTLSGTHIKGTKPLATISGHYCTDIPSDNRWCDYTVEMDLPTNVWGQHYHIPFVQDRYYPAIYRIFAKEANTTIYKDGVQIGQIGEESGPGGRKNYGWIEERVWPRNPGNAGKIATISGDKPIYVMFYNPSTQEDQGGAGTILTDPFSMTMIPIEQYQTEFIFAVPGVQEATPFQKCWFNVVYETNEFGQIPEDAEIAIIENGQPNWRSLKDWKPSVDQEFMMIGATDDEGNPVVDEQGNQIQPDFFYGSSVSGRRFKHKIVEIPNVGQYMIRGSTKMMVYVYGYENYGSFGYPTTAALADLSIPDTVAPHLTYELGCEGVIENALSLEQPWDPENQHPLMSGYFDFVPGYTENFINFETFGQEFSENGQKLTQVSFRAEVDDKTQYARLDILAFDRAGNDTTWTIEWWPEEYEIYSSGDDKTDKSQDYGLLELGDTETRCFTIENSSSYTDLIVENIEFRDETEPEFVFTDPELVNQFPITITPLETFEFCVDYTADSFGKKIDSLRVDICRDQTDSRLYEVEVVADAGGPMISVTDVDFDRNGPYILAKDPAQNEPEVLTFTVQNICLEDLQTGRTVLTLVGHDGPQNANIFQVNLDHIQELIDNQIEPANNETGETGESLEIEVFFTPTVAGSWTDEIVIQTETDGVPCDNICVINGSALETDLVAQGYDFGTISINDLDNPVMANDVNDVTPISAENNGDVTIDIRDYVATDQTVNPAGRTAEEAFFFDDQKLNSLMNQDHVISNVLRAQFDVVPGVPKLLSEIYFQPTRVGAYSMQYQLQAIDDNDNTVETGFYTIQGVATIPNVTIFDDEADKSQANLDFGTTAVQQAVPSQILTIENNNDVGVEFSEEINFTLQFDAAIDWDGGDLTGKQFLVENITLVDQNNTRVDIIGDLRNNPVGANESGQLTLPFNHTIELEISLIDDVAAPFNADNLEIRINDNGLSDKGDAGSWNFNNKVATISGEVTQPGGFITGQGVNECVNTTNIVDGDDLSDYLVYYQNNSDPGPTNNITVNLVTVNGNDLIVSNAQFDFTITGAYLINNGNVDLGSPIDLTNDLPYVVEPGNGIAFATEYMPKVVLPGNTEVTVEVASSDLDNPNAAFNVGLTSEQKTMSYDNSFNPGTPLSYIGRDRNSTVYSYYLNTPDDLSDQNITSAEFTVTFRKGYLNMDLDMPQLGTEYSDGNFEITDFEIEDNFTASPMEGKLNWMRTLRFNVNALNGAYIGNPGEVFTIDFITYQPYTFQEKDRATIEDPANSNIFFPNGATEYSVEGIYFDQDASGNVPYQISTGIRIPEGGACIANKDADLTSSIEIEYECIHQFTQIVTSGSKYKDVDIQGNPASTSTQSKVSFSLGLSADTKITIIDANGSVVNVIHDGHLKHGAHEFIIPTEDLNSGAYIVEISNQFFSTHEKFLVTK